MQKKMICSYLFWFVTILDQVQKSASPKYGHEKNDFYISPHLFLSLHTVVSSLRQELHKIVGDAHRNFDKSQNSRQITMSPHLHFGQDQSNSEYQDFLAQAINFITDFSFDVTAKECLKMIFVFCFQTAHWLMQLRKYIILLTGFN